ncbi:MAG TPA: hypothetical protein VKB85_10520 [Propionibacteriaceae bacterium]|nr:hypothetical protein [Propionibacteriaceae bacterium]
MTDKPPAEKAATWERPIGSDPRDDLTPPPADADVVGEDTFIARPDLGVDTFTLVAKGDQVPAGLERNKRSPAPRKG